ncbi:MAG: VOC family protein [Proteobacteria bacterium]|nr:VOC family protein [Pseudomonadota bacterium]
MIDHIGLEVSDYEGAKKFYAAALAPLGYTLMMEHDTQDHGRHAGFGADGKMDFWLADGRKTGPCVHICFRSPDRATVDEFYKAAIAAGGTDNGAPGIREIYHPNYYGAFVLDADGHNVEAVCHAPA